METIMFSKRVNGKSQITIHMLNGQELHEGE
jgi:hypothetical protein